jgi:hypothetical protein
LYYHPKHINNDLNDMALKLTYTSINNIEWSCLYSGMGIIDQNSEKDFKELFGYDEKNKSRAHNLKNLIPLKCIYKKGKPIFSNFTDDKESSGTYSWDATSFNKLILSSSQGFAILSMCRAAQLLQTQDKALSKVMVKTAESYYDFTTTYLRDVEGLFINVEDKTKRYDGDELKLKNNKNDSRLIDQVFIQEAFLYLHSITSDETNKDFYNPNTNKYLNDSRNIFQYIFENYHLLIELCSKEISLCISSLSRCSIIERDSEQNVNYNHLIALLCAELESRIKITGEVEKSCDDSMPASLITHFRIASALLEGYFQTSIEKFKELALRILNYLDDLYDISTGLFIQGDDTKVTYSTRDICEIIKTMTLYYYVSEKTKVLDKLAEFYKNTIEESGIIQSTPKKAINIFGHTVNITDSIPLTKDCNKAPVFVKSFRLNLKKIQNYTTSKHFHSLYSLYASYIFLFYNSPVILTTSENNLKDSVNNTVKNISFNESSNNDH